MAIFQVVREADCDPIRFVRLDLIYWFFEDESVGSFDYSLGRTNRGACVLYIASEGEGGGVEGELYCLDGASDGVLLWAAEAVEQAHAMADLPDALQGRLRSLLDRAEI